jgi:DeoR/GlpR family transcriptional regulator of sugar metabolism
MSNPLIPAQRCERIYEYLTVHKKGILERTHGGAILSRRIQFEPECAHRAETHLEEKRRTPSRV